MSRGSMTMRATVERVLDGLGTDKYGQDPTKPFVAVSALASVPCRAWSRSRVEAVGSDKRAVVEDMRAIFPHDSGVLRNDRLSIKDRRGATIFGGPVAVLTLTRRGATSSNPGHLEAMLERHV